MQRHIFKTWSSKHGNKTGQSLHLFIVGGTHSGNLGQK